MDTSPGGRDSWTGQGKHQWAYQARAPPLPTGRTSGSLTGDVATHLGPLHSENPVVHCFIQQMFTEHPQCASPILDTVLLLYPGGMQNFDGMSGSGRAPGTNTWLVLCTRRCSLHFTRFNSSL